MGCYVMYRVPRQVLQSLVFVFSFIRPYKVLLFGYFRPKRSYKVLLEINKLRKSAFSDFFCKISRMQNSSTSMVIVN